MKILSFRVLVTLAATATAFLATNPAQADISDCADPADPKRRNTYLDDIQGDPSVPNFRAFAKFIRQSLIQDIQAVRSDSDPAALVQDLLRCSGRKPRPTDFTKENQENLSDKCVLLEVWVTLQPTADEDTTKAQADIYVAAPFASMSPNLTGDCVRKNRSILSFEGAPNDGNIKGTFDTRTFVQGYAAIGGCVLAQRQGDYPRAFELLKRAETLLKQSIGNDAVSLVKKVRKELVAAGEREKGKAAIASLNQP